MNTAGKSPGWKVFTCAFFVAFMLWSNITSANNVPDWHVPDAEFRLEVKTDYPGVIGYIDLGQYALPGKLNNCIEVIDENGSRIPYYIHKNLELLFAPSAKSAMRYVYFGLKKTAEVPPWSKELGSVPDNSLLRIRIFNAYLNYMSAKEWLARQNHHIFECYNQSADWNTKYFINQSRDLYCARYFYPWRMTDLRFYTNKKQEDNADSDFTILKNGNFVLGWPGLPLACKSKDGKSYPIVRKIYSCTLYTGKREKRLWEKYIAFDCESSGCEWTINGNKAAFGEEFDLVSKEKEGTDDKIMLFPKDKNFSPMQIIRFDDDREKPYSRPDLTLKLSLPEFIFNDETLNLFVEVNSKLPNDIICYLDTIATPGNPLFTNGSEKISLPGKSVSTQNRFTQDSVFKKEIILKGESLKNRSDVEFKLRLPGMTFNSAKVKFINVKDLPPMVSGMNTLYDSDGNVVVPVIHRPELSEIRQQELPTAVINRLAGTLKVLVVADDFTCGKNSFSSTLQAMLNMEDIELEFIPWQYSGTNRLLENFAVALPFILKSDADTAIIIPPAHELHDGVPVRNECRMLAALISAFKGRNIVLATSFPPAVPNPQESELNSEIRRLAREYGAAVLDLNYFIRKNKDWAKAYRTSPEQEDTLELLPVQNIQNVCRIITNELH